MGLSAADKKSVTDSWAKVTARGFAAPGLAVFEQLFRNNPDTIPMFSYGKGLSSWDEVKSQKNAEVTAHAESVMKQIDSTIKKFDDAAGMTAELKALGGRHTGYKVSRADLAKLEPCLMTVLSSALGGGFGAIKPAWVAAYETISGLMADGIEGK